MKIKQFPLTKALVVSWLTLVGASATAQDYAFELVKGLNGIEGYEGIITAVGGQVSRDDLRPDPIIVEGTNAHLYGPVDGAPDSLAGGIFDVRLEPVIPSGNDIDLLVWHYEASRGRPFLTLGSDNKFYGTSESGGAEISAGYIFRFPHSPRASLQADTIYEFDGIQAARPNSVTYSADGALYGTTAPSEAMGSAVFKVTTNGVFTKLHDFSTTDHLIPLLQGSDGNLYGGSYVDGGGGTLFKIARPSGTYTLLHSFSGITKPSRGALVEGEDGFLYGMTSGDAGVFKIAKDGTSFSTICSFNGSVADPVGGLTKGADGGFYGVGGQGGANDTGAIFKVTTNGTLTVIYSTPAFPFYQCDSPTIPKRCYYYGAFLSGLTRAADGTFYGMIAASDGERTHGAFYRIFQPDAPAITVQPTFWEYPPQPPGGVERLRVLATGGNLSYQWRHNGTPLSNGGDISGATSAELWISNTTASAAGQYDVVITNVLGSITSAVAQITVADPMIIEDPFSRWVNYGGTTTLTVVAGGTSPLTYAWRKDGVNLTDAGNISGSATATLTISNACSANAGLYSVIVSNSSGSVTSATAQLTVNDPIILAQPIAQNVNWGMVASFSVSATGSGSLTYQWRKNGTDLTDGGSVSGATTATLTINPAAGEHQGGYSVVISNGVNLATSVTAQLQVADPIIVSSPMAQLMSLGMHAIFTASATGTGPLSYQWTKNGTNLIDGGNISGATTTTLRVLNVSSADAGQYRIRVTNSVGSVLSSPVPLMIKPAPTIVSHPASRTNAVGTTATFTVGVYDEQPVFYRWVKGYTTPLTHFVTVLSNDGKYSGVDTPTLTINNVTPADATNYFVLVATNVSQLNHAPFIPGTSRSGEAQLTVLDPPTILAEPLSRTNIVGSTATFTVGATGSALSYRWQKNGVDLGDDANISGSATATLKLQTVAMTDAGDYSVIVSNGATDLTSGNATLTVVPDDAAPILMITYPKAIAYTTNVLSIAGTAKDSARVEQVLCSFNNGPFTAAAMTYVGPGKATNWSIAVHSQTGTNKVVVMALDPSGNISLTTLTYFYHVPSTFTYSVSMSPGANGTVEPIPSMAGTPNNGEQLFVGRGYKIRAFVGPGTNSLLTNITFTAANDESGQLFANMAALPSVTLDFVMKTNLHLDFSFVHNPVYTYFGGYYGLVSDKTNGVNHASAGFLQLLVARNSSYSAKITIDGNALPIAGKMPINGEVSGMISRTNVEKNNLLYTLKMDFTGQQKVTGTISDPEAGWISEIEADRLVWHVTTNPATAWTNKYTAVAPGFTNKANGPTGFGWGLLTVGTSGKSGWSGGLGDFEIKGTRFVGSSFISKDGFWPFFQPLYNAKRTLQAINPATLQPKTIIEYKGLMMGWLELTTNHLGNLRPEGEVSWIKTGWTNVLYSGGFTNRDVPILASRWRTPTQAGQYPLSGGTTNWVVTLSDSNLAVPYEINAHVYTNKIIPVPGQPNLPGVSLVKTTGALTGRFVHPTTSKATLYFGVALQDLNYGAGWFMGPSEGGVMTFQPNP